MRARPGLLVLTFAVAVAVAACGRADGRPEEDSRSRAPKEVARAYVEAIDRRDGARFCELVAPYISGAYALYTRDPDSRLHDVRGCPSLVSSFIGYIEDCCPPEFKGAEVVRVSRVQEHGELRRVTLEIRLRVEEDGLPRLRRLQDVVWLARFDGAWRVAELSEVARAASLLTPRFSEEGEPVVPEEEPPGPPDVAAAERGYAAALAAFRRRADEREVSFQPVGGAEDCDGGVELDDPARDLVRNGGGAASVPRGADLRALRVRADEGGVCVRYELARPVQGALMATFNHRDSVSGGGFIKHFEMELRANGTARVTGGVDLDQRPVVVPAAVGLDDRHVSVVLDRRSYAASGEVPYSTGEPRFDRFVFMAVMYSPAADEPQALVDYLGPQPSPEPFGYPSGGPCEYGVPC